MSTTAIKRPVSLYEILIALILFSLALFIFCFPAHAATTQTALVTDTFVRANATTLGSNWTNFGQVPTNSTTLCNIAANKAQVASASMNCAVMYSANDFPNDQYAQVTMGVHANSGVLAGACVDSIGNVPGGNQAIQGVLGYLNGYCTWIDGSTHYNVCSTKSGLVCQTQLATSSTTPTAGDVILLTVQQVATGRQLTLFINGTQIIQTIDTANTYVTGFPGFDMSVDGTVTDVAVTNFMAGAVSTPPTIVNLPTGNGSGPTVLAGTPTQLGTITAMGQAVQFIPAPSTFTYGGRVQIIATGQISNPQWSLECSQDANRTWWFQMPAVALPTLSPQLQDSPPSFSVLYDISGLSAGSACRFGLGITTTTMITGNSVIWVIVG